MLLLLLLLPRHPSLPHGVVWLLIVAQEKTAMNRVLVEWMTGLTPAAAVRRARGMHEALRSMASSPGSLHLPASLPAKSSALSSSSSSPSSTSLSTSDARVSGAAPSVNPPASPTTVDGVKATIKPGQPNKSQEALLRRKAKELGFDLPPPEMLMTEFLNGREEVEMRIFLEDVVKLKPIPAIKYAFSSVVQQTICVCAGGGGGMTLTMMAMMRLV